MATDEAPEVPLAQMIESLRGQLQQAIAQGVDEDLHFGLGDIELELQVAVTRHKGVQGGIAISVLTLGASRSSDRALTHTLRLTLHPEGEILVGRELQGSPR